MSYRSNENKYLSKLPLRQLSVKQFTFNSKQERSSSHVDSEVQFYKTQIHNLRVRCSKIDQIERYANILLQTVESNKIKSQEMQKQNLEQLRLIEQLRGELRQMQEAVEQKEQNLRLGSMREMEKKKVQIQETFSAIKWQQELLSQRQSKEKILASMDAKYKEELSRLKQIMKGGEIKMQEELTAQKKESELTSNENAILRGSVEQLQHSLKLKEEEMRNIVLQLQNSNAKCHSMQAELTHRDQVIAQIQHDSLKTIDALDREVDLLKIEKQKVANDILNLQRHSDQLKIEGAALVAEGQVMKERILELEETRYANSRFIETLQIEMGQLKQSHGLLQANLVQTQTNYKQLSAVLEKDNVLLRKTNQNMSLEISTKQKQIQDLIAIVSTMENAAKSAQNAAGQYQQANLRINLRVRELQEVLERQTAEMTHLRSKATEAQRYACETQQNYVQAKGELLELDLAYKNEKKMIQEYDQLIGEENQKIKMGEIENQRLMKEIAQLQRALFEGKEELVKTQAKYGNQMQQLVQKGQRISQLQKINYLLQVQFGKLKQQQQIYSFQFEEQKRSQIEQALQKMQKIVSDKYEQILKQKNDHFKSKIAYLQSQLALLRKEQPQQEQIVQ